MLLRLRILLLTNRSKAHCGVKEELLDRVCSNFSSRKKLLMDLNKEIILFLSLLIILFQLLLHNPMHLTLIMIFVNKLKTNTYNSPIQISW